MSSLPPSRLVTPNFPSLLKVTGALSSRTPRHSLVSPRFVGALGLFPCQSRCGWRAAVRGAVGDSSSLLGKVVGGLRTPQQWRASCLGASVNLKWSGL